MKEFFGINELVKKATTIDDQKQYWLVRTRSGMYYNHFLAGNYIAIGYNEVSLDSIILLPESDKVATKILKERIKNIYPERKNNKYAVSQLMKFVRGIKDGDIVMIPSESSYFLSLGIVEGSAYEVPYTSDTDCPFKKRIRVRWVLPNRKKYKLHPKLQLLLASQHILSDITKYAVYIDSLMHDFYIKE